jgi:hypothetical protein
MFPRRFLDKAPPPWTDDPILAEWKFTNCFRELDRLTRYAIVHILGRDIEPMAKLPRWTPENRPVVDGAKPASRSAAPSTSVLPRSIVIEQALSRR